MRQPLAARQHPKTLTRSTKKLPICSGYYPRPKPLQASATNQSNTLLQALNTVFMLFKNQTCPSQRPGRNLHSKISRSLYLQFALLFGFCSVLHRYSNRVIRRKGFIRFTQLSEQPESRLQMQSRYKSKTKIDKGNGFVGDLHRSKLFNAHPQPFD